MKKSLVLTMGMFMALQAWAQKDPVLMEIDNKKITQSEFLQVYLKNNPNPKYDNQTLDEYMELYRKFQLKVAEAESKGYDTIPKLRNELQGYQKQLAQPYLTDRQMNEYLVKEAYERLKKEVRASHILIKTDPTYTPADTLKAYQKAMDIRTRLLKGEDFNTLAKLSDDPSAAVNYGDLGFFTAFQMVFPFEDAVYNLKSDEISMPIRTRFGYHLIKKTDERPARGTMKAAHILIAAHKEMATESELESAKNKAQELYNKLMAGEQFETLVRQYSDDHSSASNSGILPPFGAGATTRLVPEFENAAFQLKHDGDISKPIQTNFGFHIIKRIEQKDLPSYEESKKDLENRVNRDERALKTQKSYIQKLKVEFNYKDLSKKSLKWFDKNIDSNVYKAALDLTPLNKKNLPVFELNGKKYTQKDFGEYLNVNGRLMRSIPLAEIPSKAFEKYVNEVVISLEKEQLTKKYPEYKALLTEYHDGILLYEIMSDEVWNKAMTDSTGLEQFFKANQNNYRWDKRFNATIYEFQNEKLANQGMIYLKKGIASDSIIKLINKESELNLRMKSNKFEVNKTPSLQNRELKKGINPIFNFEGKFFIVDVTDVIEPTDKVLSEAKGIATSDYQNYLEKEWLKKLEQKHKVIINTDVLHKIGK